MVEELAKIGIVVAVIIVLAIAVYTIFGNFFVSPQEFCASFWVDPVSGQIGGALYDPIKDICISASGISQSCAPLISNGTCQLGLECAFDLLSPLNGFFTCQGELHFPFQGGS